MKEWKAGDYALCLKTYNFYTNDIQFTKGSAYLVHRVSGRVLQFAKDDTGRHNGWDDSFFLNLGKDKDINKIEKLIYNIK